MKGVPLHNLPTAFSSHSSAPFSMPLFTKYWAGHHLLISESKAFTTFIAKIGTKTHMTGTLCCAALSPQLCLTGTQAQPKPMVPDFRSASAEMGLISPGGENLLHFLELRQVLSTYDGDLRDPLWWPQERPVPLRVALGPLGIVLPSMPGPKTLCGFGAGT